MKHLKQNTKSSMKKKPNRCGSVVLEEENAEYDPKNKIPTVKRNTGAVFLFRLQDNFTALKDQWMGPSPAKYWTRVPFPHLKH